MELDMTWLRYQVDADDCMWQQELHCSFAKERILSEQLKSILISNSKISFFFWQTNLCGILICKILTVNAVKLAAHVTLEVFACKAIYIFLM